MPLSPLENPFGPDNVDGFSDSVEATLFELLNTRIENSTYLANRIFSLVAEALDKPDSAGKHLAELRKLADMYKEASSTKTRSLITAGISLIEEEQREQNGD